MWINRVLLAVQSMHKGNGRHTLQVTRVLCPPPTLSFITVVRIIISPPTGV